MYIFICEWNVFLLKLLEASSFSWSVMFSEVWSSWPFSNKAHVHCLDLILQIFSTDTSYLVLKDTSRIPSPFSRPLDVFASLEDLWPFQTPQTNMIYSVLLQNKPEDLSKLLEKKCGEKKAKTARLYNMSAAETIETHAKALTDTQCSFPVRRYQQPQHEGLSQTRVCVIYN